MSVLFTALFSAASIVWDREAHVPCDPILFLTVIGELLLLSFTQQIPVRTNRNSAEPLLIAGQKKGRRRVATGASRPASHHRRSDGGPERRQWCPDGGSEHRYEWYTESPPYVSRPNDDQIPGTHSCHSAAPLLQQDH